MLITLLRPDAFRALQGRPFSGIVEGSGLFRSGSLFEMEALHARLGLAVVALAAAVTAFGQTAEGSAAEATIPQATVTTAAPDAPAIPVPSVTPALQMLRSFRNSDVKFDVDRLMSL